MRPEKRKGGKFGRGNPGPGRLAERIRKLKDKLKDQEFEEAERLSKSKPFRVLQTAWYLASQRRSQDILRRRAERARRVLAELEGKLPPENK